MAIPPASGDLRDRVIGTTTADNRNAIGRAGELNDPASEDMFTEISRTTDLDLYAIEGHLQGR